MNRLALIITAGLMAVFLGSCSRVETAAPRTETAVNAPAPPLVQKPEDETIRFLENRLKRDPDDFIACNKLASEYLQRLRESGDIAYLDLAARAARSSLNILPAEQNKGGLIATIQVENASHDFAAARDNAKRLIELDPNKGYTFQFLGDALMELGQYDDAEAAFRKMEKFGGVQTMTKVAMEQRWARVAFLHGDNAEARRRFTAALKLAQSMPEPPKETVAWCQWQLGETAFAVGDYKTAERYYRDSLATFSDYYRSLASLGRVRAAQGDIAGGIEQLEKAVHIIPDPSFVALLGDLYKLSGREDDASQQYALVEKIGTLTAISGALYNRQLANFYADHDMRPDAAFSDSSREYEIRKDVYGADTVAWTALKAGKLDDARAAIAKALSQRTADAKIYYHAGMIAKATGETDEAKRWLSLALKTNPEFDPLQTTVAKAALQSMN